MSEHSVHHFGIVDDTGDFFDLHWDGRVDGQCRLEQIAQSERGPRRNEIAVVPEKVWDLVCSRVVRELREGMGKSERLKRLPTIKKGITRLSPLIGRELAVLLWALMEMREIVSVEPILHSWRELAREERWWLFAKASVPGQRMGSGWRRALFHALSETPESPVIYLLPEQREALPQPLVGEEAEKEIGSASNELNRTETAVGNVMGENASNHPNSTSPPKRVGKAGAKKGGKRSREVDPKQKTLF